METKTNKELTSKALQDYAIVQRAVAGESKAYAELSKRYRDPIYHKMYSFVRNREDADDLTQEAFAKAFNKLESYTPRFAFSTWLFRIAINNCIDFIRKKKLAVYSIDEKIDKDSDQDFTYNLQSQTLNPEQTIIRQQKVKETRSVLRRLNKKYRLMIELRYFEEKTYEEISRELEIPLGTVKAQLFRAKELLHNMLKQSVRAGTI